ncbi:MAG: hypothetical protein A2W28_04235 [Gammaproteobacteria bacterium RBG_16_51_14]|nr:MAG: hypothetical protein A2W28_04235 [Gammaproteobacteria bacterium RBG_16_51_14]
MNILTITIFIAFVVTVGSLLIGIIAMGRGGEFDEKYNHLLMFSRVGSQGILFVLLLLALYLAGK